MGEQPFEYNIKNTIFRRESLGQINVPNPVPNQMNNMPNSSKNIDVFNKINNPEVSTAFNRNNSDVTEQKITEEEYFQPYMRKQNIIISSMK